MATAYTIKIDLGCTGLLGCSHDEATASKLSEFLQKDLESHHTFTNAKGWHNHMAHHLLAIYGTGGGIQELQHAFDNGAQIQIESLNTHEGILEELQRDWTAASKYLDNGAYYPDFLKYFQCEIDKKGWQHVLLEYMFSGEEKTQDLFSRGWATQTAIHTTYVGDFLTRVERMAAENPPTHSLSLPELLEHVGSDSQFVNSVRYGNPNEILDGVEVLCPDEAIEYLSQVKEAHPDHLEEGIAENIRTSAYMASASVFHPPNEPKFDFFLIHHLTSAPLLHLVSKVSWIPVKVKQRVLAWKNRYDIPHYVIRWCPPLRTQSIIDYTPKGTPRTRSMEDMLPLFYDMPDDGHIVKTARAFSIARLISQKFIDKAWIRIKDDST